MQISIDISWVSVIQWVLFYAAGGTYNVAENIIYSKCI